MKFKDAIFCLLILGIFVIFLISKEQYHRPFKSVIRDVRGAYLKLESGDVVKLVGVNVPTQTDENYSAEVESAVHDLLINKPATVKIIIKSDRARFVYPTHDLVEIYLENKNMNRYLMERGFGFFSYDFFQGKNALIALEKKAKQMNLGLWKIPPRILYVSSENWDTLHYEGCPEILKMRKQDLQYYYSRYQRRMRGKSISMEDKYCYPKYIDWYKKVSVKPLMYDPFGNRLYDER